MKAFDTLADLLTPQGLCCLVCGGVRAVSRENALCPACEQAIRACRVQEDACVRCRLRVVGETCAYCTRFPMPAIHTCFAPFEYRDAVRAYILSFKFGQTGMAAAYLGREMAGALTRMDYDILVPVPMHRSRQLQRGRNQAELLAREVSRLTGIPTANAIQRIRRTRTQSRLPGEKRADNVKNAFRARMGMRGMRVLLIDDVRTTGATAEACAEALAVMGVIRCDLLTAAVTPRNRLNEIDRPEGMRF